MAPLERELRQLLDRMGVAPKAIHLVSRGYSLVYRVRIHKGTDWALLLRRSNKRAQELDAELEILHKLAQPQEGLRCPVPVKLGGADVVPLQVGDRLLSAFDWIEHVPFGGSPEETMAAFTGFLNLEFRLRSLSRPQGLPTLALMRDDFSVGSIDFGKYAGCVPAQESWGKAYCANISTLNLAVQLLTEGLRIYRPQIMSMSRSVIHYDPSPGNFGFGESKNAICLFDFDQCKWGIQEYDLPWMLWSFAAHHLPESGAQEELIRRICRYYDWLKGTGLRIDGSLFWFFLLFRFCITLHGRLRDTYEHGFYNLRFMEEKVGALVSLVQSIQRLPK